MYRVKFPSGEEATIESLEALKDAVAAGTVTSYCYIMHQRTGQWLPIVRHPHYHQALTARSGGAAKAPAMPEILVDPLDQAAGAPETRTTAAALDVPALDDLLEMTEPAAAEPALAEPAPSPAPEPAAARRAPAPDQPRPRGRSRDLEFLYVPEARAARPPAPAQAPAPAVPVKPVPRTAGPPPRPNAAPKLGGAPAPAPTPRTPQTPAAAAAPAPKASPAPEAAASEAAAAAPAPRMSPAPAAVPAAATAPVLAPTVMLETEAPPADEPVRAKPAETAAPRPTERFDHNLMDPVEAALNFETPAPIELDRPRAIIPAGRARLMLIAAGVVVALGGGMLAWSPWSGEPSEVALATPAGDTGDRGPAADAQEVAMPDVDLSGPAEVDPALDSPIYDVSPDAPFSSHTSFGGTAAPSDEPLPPAAASPNRLPGAPRTAGVAVPVLGAADPSDSLRLARLKQAIAQPDEAP